MRTGLTAVRAVVVLAVSVLMLSMLPGCQSGRRDSSAAARTEGFNLGLTSVRDATGAAGGTLRLVTGPVDSLDPARSYQFGLWNLMRLYTRQLVSYAPAPGPAGTRLLPDLATSLGRPGNGGRTWTYVLKPGLRFETGQPITAADVKYGIEREFAAGTLAGGPTWLVQLLDDPRDPYPGPYQDLDLHKGGLPAIQTPNSRTVVFRLNRPFAAFDQVLAMPTASPVPQRLDTRRSYGSRPVSSGPYRFAAPFQPGTGGTLVLVRNPAWDRRTDPIRAALPDRVELDTGLAAADRDARLLAGSADLDVTGAGLQPDAVLRVTRDPALAARTDNPANGNLRLVALPSTVPPMDNAHCRRAVQLAVDKAAVKIGLGGDFGAMLATTLWPRTLPGYPATAPYPSGEGNHGDLATARAELRLCGRPNGFATRIATVDSGRGLRAAQEVRQAVARVGIQAELRPFPAEVFLASGAGSPKAVRDGRYGMVVVNWAADFGSPAAFYPPLLDGRNARTIGNTNYAQLIDTGLEKLADVAAGTLDRTMAEGTWRRVDEVAMQRAVYVPLVEDKAVLLTGARVRNGYVHPAWRNVDLAAVGVGVG
ncbi:MAG TPA: ABC transporter substrate-binding protein [Mycobacteriales bacterium]|nr:ABC transporter substrate-binding protein [Mycobacteriales bacterium]